MPGRMEMPDGRTVDIGKRFDIYVQESSSRVVVYRRAFFRGIRKLEELGRYDLEAEFIEIEQENGESLFVRKYGIIKFCEVGASVGGEVVAE